MDDALMGNEYKVSKEHPVIVLDTSNEDWFEVCNSNEEVAEAYENFEDRYARSTDDLAVFELGPALRVEKEIRLTTIVRNK